MNAPTEGHAINSLYDNIGCIGRPIKTKPGDRIGVIRARVAVDYGAKNSMQFNNYFAPLCDSPINSSNCAIQQQQQQKSKKCGGVISTATYNTNIVSTEHPVEVVGRIRDYPDRKQKQTAIQVLPNGTALRVKTELGYRDFSLDEISLAENDDLDAFYKKFVESRIDGITLDVLAVGGRLMLVDMARSENIDQAGLVGFEVKLQTAKINQGNIALKRVIEAIANGDSHVSFRDNKLTMLLQDNNINYWRKFVAEYFAPHAKKR
eukprot:Gb_21558 [translate_table: standard]